MLIDLSVPEKNRWDGREKIRKGENLSLPLSS